MAAIAGALRPYGIRTHLSVSFAAPMLLGGPDTADPLDPAVRDWWARATARVYEAVPDFGGYVVKADSEGRPGPFAYGRSHADGANMLAAALEPHGGTVHWRAFVYDHRQDWRDRSTDRARAAYDHFTPLEGEFADNAVLQVKHGPMDFQVREPVSPLIGAMPDTRLAVELQITQEYTGQQKHVCWLGPMWSEVLRFRPDGEVPVGRLADGLVAVSNAGDDRFWTGHPSPRPTCTPSGGWRGIRRRTRGPCSTSGSRCLRPPRPGARPLRRGAPRHGVPAERGVRGVQPVRGTDGRPGGEGAARLPVQRA
ncbi:hypothetical protein STREPTOSP366_52530 [Streptomyces variabilis]